MRRATVALLLAAACTTPPTRKQQRETFRLVQQADSSIAASDWTTARRTLEQAALDDPRSAVVTLRLAHIQLEAFGEIDAAEALYWSLNDRFPERTLYGLALCALWRGDEARAIELMRESLKKEPTANCARALAVRLLGRGEEAAEVLDVVDEISGETARSKLLLAAAGRAPRPLRLPEGWSWALERARLLPLEEARAEVDAYLDAACATPEAKRLTRRVLEGDFALRRNPGGPVRVR